MIVIGTAVAAAVVYGVSDFFGGLAARRLRTFPSTLLTYAVATVTILLAWPLVPGSWTLGSVLAGSLAGVFAIVGFLAFYTALAIGPISLLSPLIAVLGSVVPVIVAVAAGERLGALTIAAIVVAVVAAALISLNGAPGASRVTARALVLSVVAGILLGLSIAVLDFAPEGSGLLPAVVELVVGLAIVAVVYLVAGRRGVPEETDTAIPRARLFAVVAGVLLGAANALIVLALAAGELAIVSVLVGLYPVATVILAGVVLRERMSRVQVAGVVLAVAASVMLAVS
jgi:drug/metabolite transporter (DMT)-like permease